MIVVRTLTQKELSPDPQEPSPGLLPDDFRTEYASVHSRPHWCFVAEDERNGESVPTLGYVGYRAPQSHGDRETVPEEIILFDLGLPWHADFLPIGAALLRTSLSRLSEQGARWIRWEFASTDFWDEAERPNPLAPHWHQVALSVGMTLRQEKVSFRHDALPSVPAPDSSLVFRPLAEVGQAAYIAAIERVTEGTLDRVYQQDRERWGPSVAAQHFFRSIAEDMTYEPHCWKLAYAGDGALVGLVAPLKMWEPMGTIGYIGVVPEQRGKGYGIDLLREGHAVCFANGINRIVADTDSENFPMQRAFRQADYREQGTHWTFRTNIADVLTAVSPSLSPGGK